MSPAALRACGAALASVLCAGCAAVSDLTGAVAGLAAGAATANPAIGISVGIATRAVTREAIQYVARSRREAEQDAIVAAAGGLEVGASRAWSVDQAALGDASGEVRVMRLIATPLAQCKELAFSISGSERDGTAWYTTVACHDGARWKWAAAEPAVDRWGNLQ